MWLALHVEAHETWGIFKFYICATASSRLTHFICVFIYHHPLYRANKHDIISYMMCLPCFPHRFAQFWIWPDHACDFINGDILNCLGYLIDNVTYCQRGSSLDTVVANSEYCLRRFRIAATPTTALALVAMATGRTLQLSRSGCCVSDFITLVTIYSPFQATISQKHNCHNVCNIVLEHRHVSV